MTLIDQLKTIADPRSPRGKRHPLWLVLFLALLGSLCGYWGYRPLAEFVEIYGQDICQKLELASETKLPSYSTFRRVMQQLDDHVLAAVFTDWIQLQHPVDAGEWSGLPAMAKVSKGV